MIEFTEHYYDKAKTESRSLAPHLERVNYEQLCTLDTLPRVNTSLGFDIVNRGFSILGMIFERMCE